MLAYSELVRLAQAGDRGAEEHLFRDLEPMLSGVVRRASRRLGNVDADDLLQDARLESLLAIRRWSPSGGASLPGFVEFRARGACLDSARKARRQRRRCGTVVPAHTQDATEGDVVDDKPLAEELVAAKLEQEHLAASIDELAPRDAHFIRELVAGETYQDAGRAIGISRSRASRLVPQVLERLAAILRAAARTEIRPPRAA